LALNPGEILANAFDGQFDLIRWPGIDQKDVILSVLHRRLTANAAQR
jgi:hypothetical protein